MTNLKLIGSTVACASLLAFASLAQDNPPPAQSLNLDLAGLPAEHGIYYHAAAEWVGLAPTVLLPFSEGKSMALEILNVGSDHTVAELPGSHAGTQIVNDARPIFFLHGILPDQVYLVRTVSKGDYREFRMPVSRHFSEWAHFRAKDLVEFDVVDVNGDVVAIRPRSELGPGEYTLASSVQRDDRWLRLGYSFGLLAGRAGQ